ncbi:class I SAM-dependent methyltransferase [Nitrosomonas aestuarii]|uniref:class I SAM-dependent methyltransferase n=1 Tax=Nitrosomonas aestuarii TaxID=52441 RepID=UPI0011B1CDC1|nr:class I SAM-dependent methyltransferase [Nitrosomonas aestuarii]
MPARHDGRGRNGMCYIVAAHREKVQEIGCSNGRITEYLQQTSWYRIHGLDYSGVAIGQVRERIRGKQASLDSRVSV